MRNANILISAAAMVTMATQPLPAQSREVLVRIETSLGNIDLAIDVARAPITAGNFLKYVDGGFYDGGRFHRATRARGRTWRRRSQSQGSIECGRRGARVPPVPKVPQVPRVPRNARRKALSALQAQEAQALASATACRRSPSKSWAAA